MFISKLRVLRSHGVQYIKDLRTVELPQIFRGRPIIRGGITSPLADELCELCPTAAIQKNPMAIDLGRCLFCGECELLSKGAIKFTNDYRMATTTREALIIKEDSQDDILFNTSAIRSEIHPFFGSALKLRQVSAGGDNSCEMELNASGNVNFDFGRYGVDFVASPRHADGVVITGAITQNMKIPLDICYNAISDPKIVILAGSEAISGGLFRESDAIDRSFLEYHNVDLYLPGNPVHPLTFINGVLDLIQKTIPEINEPLETLETTESDEESNTENIAVSE